MPLIKNKPSKFFKKDESSSSDDSDTESDNSSIYESSDSSQYSESSKSESESESENDKKTKLSVSKKTSDPISAPKKRGRPRKNLDNVQHNKVIKPKKLVPKKEEDDDLLLHLRIYDDSLSEKNKFTMHDDSDGSYDSSKINTIIPLSDQEDTSSDDADINVSDLLKELKKKDQVIKKLRETLDEYKNTNIDNSVFATKDVKKSYNDLKLIDISSKKQIIADKTDICCWYDSEKFDNIPFHIVDKYTNDTYYVFGCFCSVECALAYNLALGDSRTNIRNALTRSLCYKIFGENIQINIAWKKELLKKFGGPMTIDEFRNKSLLCKKDIKMNIPPLMPMIAVIEESSKDAIHKFKSGRQ